MPGRDALRAEFISSAGWTLGGATPIAGDASRRSYLRLHQDGQTAILMDAPPEAGEDTRAFHRISDHLRTHGLAAPKILRADHDAGFLLLEDLGPDQVAACLRDQPKAETQIYTAVAEVLTGLRGCPTLSDLPHMTPQVATQMLTPFFDHAAPSAPRSEIEEEIESLFASLPNAERTLSLRDFHAENLIWRPDLSGINRIGLLDFQDAFIAPAAYDLVSLLRDARRDVSEETEHAVINRFAAGSGQDRDALDREIAILSVQRNLRILGIFARLIHVEGKPRYGGFVPRVTRHILRDLDHPALGRLRLLVLGHLDLKPRPT